MTSPPPRSRVRRSRRRSSRSGRRSNGRPFISLALLAAVAYPPLLRTAPGWVGADTKHYLYLDPWKLMTRASSVWDPSIGLGTVSHQNIGYLWPMGPWYALFDLLNTPDWVAQRLWLATLFFAAGAGTLLLLRVLGLQGVGAFVAAFAYQLSPYVLTYAARITAILLPWAGLPWLLLFTVLALRRGGWRWPAAIALLVTTIGSINASSLLYAGLAAALWLPYSVVVLREVSWSRAAGAVLRIGALTSVTQVWWLAALALSGAYGPPVLKTTETLEAVSASSVTTELVRGLGNWFFYGRDAVGPWVEAAVDYQTEGWLIAVTFALPLAALIGAAVTRWAHRAYFLTLIVIGAVIAVASHPYEEPSPIGALTKLAADSSTFALALRNAQRATPLLVLGMAVMLGAGIHAIGRRVDRGDVLAAVAAAVFVALSLPALWSGGLVDANLRRPENIPAWNTEAARALDARGDATRVLELPGTDFAAFRWGNTIDPLLPGLIDRPWVSRESAPQGSKATISLITALDRRVQEGLLEPRALGPTARLVSAGDVVVRGDLQTERYRTPRPRVLADMIDPTPDGLGAPTEYGPRAANVPPAELPLVDEITLGLADGPDLASLTVLPVEDPQPIVRLIDGSAPLLVDGDGEGIVELAEAGVIDGGELLLYGPTATAASLLEDGSSVVVTDTNRRRAQRFTQLRENYGYTEIAGERPLRVDAADARIDLFPDAGDDARTVTVLRGGIRSVRATAYGNTITYIPEERPVAAVDGDPATAWRVGAFESPIGHRLEIALDTSRSIDHLQLVQPLTGDRNRWITKVRLSIDGSRVADVPLDDSSRTPAGQRVSVPRQQGSVVALEVLEDNIGRRPEYIGLSAVGFAEVGIDGVVMEEWVRPPRTLLTGLASRLDRHDLTFVFGRVRSNPREPVRADPERRIARLIDMPSARRFALTGTARVSTRIDDATIDRILGTAGAVTATSSSRLPGSLRSRASSAIDGDTATAWTPAFQASGEQWVEIALPNALTIDRLDLQVVADGRHSVPDLIQIESEEGVRTIVLPDIADPAPGGVATVPVTFEPLRGARFRMTVGDVRVRTTVDYFSRAHVPLPIAIAEVGLPGVRRPPLPASFGSGCRDDLVQLDGQPIAVELHGASADAEAGGGVAMSACAPLEVARGEHTIESAVGQDVGWDVDQLVLDSEATSRPVLGADGSFTPGSGVEAERTSRSSHRLRVARLERPAWLVLGESWSEGWHATVDGRDLGPPILASGYANAWRLDPEVHGDQDVVVKLRWRPQRLVTVALAVSAIGAVVCLVLLVKGRGHAENARTYAIEAPAWAPPSRSSLAPTVGRAVAVLAFLAAFAALVADPWLAPLVVAISVAAMFAPFGRLLPSLAACCAVAASAAGTIVLEVRHQYPPGFGWASNLDRLHPVGWMVFLALAVEVALSLVFDGWNEPHEMREGVRGRPEVV